MTYRTLADLVVGLHFLFVLFVVLGGLLVLKWPRLAYLHIPAAVYGAAIEKSLRARAGDATYEAGFVEHYILPVLYPAGLTRATQWVLGVLVIGVNLAVYWWVGRTRRRQR
jgi:hypothetical protein